MSSSYVSAAELEQRRQAELERQRQERLRKIKEATAQYNRCMSRYEEFRAHVSVSMQKELQSFRLIDELRFACDSFQSVKLNTDSEISKLLAVSLPVEPEDIQKLNKTLTSKLETLGETYGQGLSEFSDRISLYKKGQADLSRSNEFSAALSKIEKEKQHEYSNVSFDVSASTNEADESVSLDSVIQECSLLINNSAIGRTEKSQLMGILDELYKSQESNDAAVSQTLILQYKSLRGNVKRNIRVFNDLYSQYCALHIEWVRMQKGKKLPLPAPLPKHSFNSISGLEQEIESLDQKTKTENERTYVREQIDEVMDLFGYNTAESIVLKGSSKGQHYLFESQADAAPVHLYMSEGNSIMMEMVGLDDLEDNGHTEYDGLVVTDEIPDRERHNIVENQKGFCSLHPKLVEELKKRGVLINVKQRKEAGMKSAKKLRIRGKRPSFDGAERQSQAEYRIADQKLKTMQEED